MGFVTYQLYSLLAALPLAFRFGFAILFTGAAISLVLYLGYRAWRFLGVCVSTTLIYISALMLYGPRKLLGRAKQDAGSPGFLGALLHSGQDATRKGVEAVLAISLNSKDHYRPDEEGEAKRPAPHIPWRIIILVFNAVCVVFAMAVSTRIYALTNRLSDQDAVVRQGALGALRTYCAVEGQIVFGRFYSLGRLGVLGTSGKIALVIPDFNVAEWACVDERGGLITINQNAVRVMWPQRMNRAERPNPQPLTKQECIGFLERWAADVQNGVDVAGYYKAPGHLWIDKVFGLAYRYFLDTDISFYVEGASSMTTQRLREIEDLAAIRSRPFNDRQRREISDSDNSAEAIRWLERRVEFGDVSVKGRPDGFYDVSFLYRERFGRIQFEGRLSLVIVKCDSAIYILSESGSLAGSSDYSEPAAMFPGKIMDFEDHLREFLEGKREESGFGYSLQHDALTEIIGLRNKADRFTYKVSLTSGKPDTWSGGNSDFFCQSDCYLTVNITSTENPDSTYAATFSGTFCWSLSNGNLTLTSIRNIGVTVDNQLLPDQPPTEFLPDEAAPPDGADD